MSVQQVAFRGFANPVDPTPAELRAWAYNPDSMTLQHMPQACCSLLRALREFLHPRTHAVIRVGGEAEAHVWRAAAADAATAAATDIYFIPATAEAANGLLAAQRYVAGGVAYVCRGVQCMAPLTEPAQLASLLADA